MSNNYVKGEQVNVMVCYKDSKTKVLQYFKDATETLVSENKHKQKLFHNIQAGWDFNERGGCAVHPAEEILMRFVQFPVSCLQTDSVQRHHDNLPEVVTSAVGWPLCCTADADASLSCCGI